MFDPDGDGAISADEIGCVLRETCEWVITDEEVPEELSHTLRIDDSLESELEADLYA